jgi:uncharacterized protein YndB with AHSA1/START domain
MSMVSSGKATVELPADDQILITREFDAPKRLVYRAYTEPELVKRWWSGERGEVTHAEIDLRVGGYWRSVMITHGGLEVAFHGEYQEIVENERLVSTEVYEGAPQPEGGTEQGTLNTATFEERDGRTLLTVLVQCPSKEVRDAIIESGMEGGMQEAYDKLEQVAQSLR